MSGKAKGPRRRLRRRDRAALARLFDQAERLRAERAFGGAETLYRQVLAESPRHLAAMRGRAAALDGMGQKRRAEAQRAKADRLEADNICDVAGKAVMDGRLATAMKLFRRALALKPDCSEAVWGIAECHHGEGRRKTAIDWYRKYLELEPDEPEALHMLASLGVGPAPDRASDSYVTAHFDRFATDFDAQLLDELEYRGPEGLFEVVERALGGDRTRRAILDLGCGTGLAGRRFKALASRIDGVDLSSAMLGRARRRRLYDMLVESDITSHMHRTRRRYELVLAADTLIYLGDLAPVFAGAARVLRDGGLFAFSVEARDGARYWLTDSGRYAHGRGYVRRVAAEAAFDEAAVARQPLRTEFGKQVFGDYWVFRKPARNG